MSGFGKTVSVLVSSRRVRIRDLEFSRFRPLVLLVQQSTNLFLSEEPSKSRQIITEDSEDFQEPESISGRLIGCRQVAIREGENLWSEYRSTQYPIAQSGVRKSRSMSLDERLTKVSDFRGRLTRGRHAKGFPATETNESVT